MTTVAGSTGGKHGPRGSAGGTSAQCLGDLGSSARSRKHSTGRRNQTHAEKGLRMEEGGEKGTNPVMDHTHGKDGGVSCRLVLSSPLHHRQWLR